MLNENIHLEFYVFVILFIFQITGKIFHIKFSKFCSQKVLKFHNLGTIKNIILVCLANKKISEMASRAVTEQSESQLSDTNA